MTKKLKKILYFIIATVIIVHIIIVGLFYKVKQDSFYENSSKYWSHRGYENNCEENSLLSVKEAITKNYGGVELDVWFEGGVFKVKHNQQQKRNELLLKQVFELNTNVKFWIDLKNLNSSNIEPVMKRLKELSSINNQFIVESKSAWQLSKIKGRGFNTCLWVNPTGDNILGLYFSKKGIKELFNMSCISMFKFNGVSMPLKLYENEKIQKRYKHLNIHLWTNKSRLDSSYIDISNRQEVKIILDDQEFYESNSDSISLNTGSK